MTTADMVERKPRVMKQPRKATLRAQLAMAQSIIEELSAEIIRLRTPFWQRLRQWLRAA